MNCFLFLLIKNHYYNYQVKLQCCISNVYKILNWVCLWWNNFIISYHIVDLSIMSFNSSFLIQIYTYHLLYYGAMYILEFFFLLCFKNFYLSFLYLFIHFLLLYKYESLLFTKKTCVQVWRTSIYFKIIFW